MTKEWIKVDASWLPESSPNLVAEFFDDGQLRRFARMDGDECVAELTLEHDVARGTQTDHRGSGGTSDWVTHVDGFSETFDAWSDNSKPFRDPFADWVRRSITRVVGTK